MALGGPSWTVWELQADTVNCVVIGFSLGSSWVQVLLLGLGVGDPIEKTGLYLSVNENNGFMLLSLNGLS